MILSCIIVEDQEEDMEILQRFIGKGDSLTLKATFTNVNAAKQYLLENDVDLIFSDIMIGDNDGLSFIRSLENCPQVIFTTSYPNFAVTGFELNATDYLVKPYTYIRFSQGVAKAIAKKNIQVPHSKASIQEELPKVAEDHFFIRSKYNIIRINYDDVIYVEGMKDYITIVTKDQVYASAIHLKIIEEQLPQSIFMRIHRSFIVNINKIDSLNNTEIIARGKTLPLGENYKENFMKSVLGKKVISKPGG